MAIFKVLKQVDAWVNYETEVEANSAEEAARLAADDDGVMSWEQGDVSEYDHRVFSTVGEDGTPIESTKIEIN